MQKREYKHQSLSLPYYVRGQHPGLLLTSGAHGDEYEVIDSVRAAIGARQDSLPDFLYIPEISPSSVASRCRANYRNKDINRQFVDGTECGEAQAVMRLLGGRTFTRCISFHEDPEQEQFYLYDTGAFSSDELLAMRSGIRACGVELFSGIDDPEDEFLGFEFKDGYRPRTGADGKPIGPLETWLIRKGIVKRVFGVEVPGKADKETKDKIVRCLFECLFEGANAP